MNIGKFYKTKNYFRKFKNLKITKAWNKQI